MKTNAIFSWLAINMNICLLMLVMHKYGKAMMRLLLGITIDKEIKFKEHISKLCKTSALHWTPIRFIKTKTNKNKLNFLDTLKEIP